MSDCVESRRAEDGPLAAAWRLPLIVAAIVVSTVAGSYVGGPGLGMAIGAIAAGSIVVVAARNAPRDPIVGPAADDDRAHVLLVVSEPLESPTAIERVVGRAAAEDRAPSEADFHVLAPRHERFLDRWTSDTERGLAEAQRCLVLTLASLAKAGIAATARTGDENPVQAVEDELSTYPATQVIYVDRAAAAARELRARLRVPLLHLAGGASETPGTLVGSSRR